MPLNQTQFYLLPILEIFKKELRAFFQSHMAWIILFMVSTLNGLMGWWAIHKELASDATLQLIFYRFSGTAMIASTLIGMRFFSEEKSLGTMELLITAPIHESQMVLGKVLSAVVFLLIIMFCSLPVPIMVIIFGDAHLGHIVSGYIGIFFIGTSSILIATFYSTLTKIQLVASLMAIGNICLLLLLGFFSPYIDPPMKNILREFSLYVQYRDFEKGVLMLHHVVYFISIIVFYYYITIASLKSRRWQS